MRAAWIEDGKRLLNRRVRSYAHLYECCKSTQKLASFADSGFGDNMEAGIHPEAGKETNSFEQDSVLSWK